jgi:hypothetical protein
VNAIDLGLFTLFWFGVGLGVGAVFMMVLQERKDRKL